MTLLTAFRLMFSILFCISTGAISSVFAIDGIAKWYPSLKKPSFTPPDEVFGPAWMILYFLMGISVSLVWTKGVKKPAVQKALILFLIQLALNAVWSFLFFGLRSPLYGLADILILWVMILATLGQFAKISLPAAVLLIPYLLWVTFAAGLNLGIYLLNR